MNEGYIIGNSLHSNAYSIHNLYVTNNELMERSVFYTY